MTIGLVTRRAFARGSASAEAGALEAKVSALACYRDVGRQALFTPHDHSATILRITIDDDGDEGAWPPIACPGKAQHWLVDTDGEMRLESCHSNQCLKCVPWRAFTTAGAVALAGPNYALVLTKLPPNYDQARLCLQRLTRSLRRELSSFELAWNVERNPRGTGRHAHAWARCSHLDQSMLRQASSRAGMGMAFVEPMKAPTDTPITYSMKDILTLHHLPTRDDAQAVLEGHLVDHGGHLICATRSFWLDSDGNHATMRQARRCFVQSKIKKSEGMARAAGPPVILPTPHGHLP